MKNKTKIHGNTTHGKRYTQLYSVWKNMFQRCYRPSNTHYHRYGGRGITICKEWLENPGSFVIWGETHGYILGLELDRIDNDGNYYPENCQFITRKENIAKKPKRPNHGIYPHQTATKGVVYRIIIWNDTKFYNRTAYSIEEALIIRNKYYEDTNR
jgi:hypothetical protein